MQQKDELSFQTYFAAVLEEKNTCILKHYSFKQKIIRINFNGTIYNFVIFCSPE